MSDHLTPEQLKILNQLIDWLQTPEAQEEFDMAHWVGETSCGTTMCMGGYIEVVLLLNMTGSVYLQGYGHQMKDDAVGAAIGLDHDQTLYAFYGLTNGSRGIRLATVTPKIASNFMINWRDHAILDWYLAKLPEPTSMQNMGQVSSHIKALETSNQQLAESLQTAMKCMKRVDAYLTRLQSPGSEPLNSVNAGRTKKERSQFTASVRNEAREYWADLGNTIEKLEKAHSPVGKEKHHE